MSCSRVSWTVAVDWVRWPYDVHDEERRQTRLLLLRAKMSALRKQLPRSPTNTQTKFKTNNKETADTQTKKYTKNRRALTIYYADFP